MQQFRIILILFHANLPTIMRLLMLVHRLRPAYTILGYTFITIMTNTVLGVWILCVRNYVSYSPVWVSYFINIGSCISCRYHLHFSFLSSLPIGFWNPTLNLKLQMSYVSNRVTYKYNRHNRWRMRVFVWREKRDEWVLSNSGEIKSLSVYLYIECIIVLKVIICLLTAFNYFVTVIVDICLMNYIFIQY